MKGWAGSSAGWSGERKPRWLRSGAAVSLVGYPALPAQQQIFVFDYGTRAWVRILRQEVLSFASLVLWRVSLRWAIDLPVLMLDAGELQAC